MRNATDDGADSPLPLVIFERITEELAQVLRDVGCGYADESGELYLPGRPIAPPRRERIAESVHWAIGEQVADRDGRFALLDLLSGGGAPLNDRDLSGLARRPEVILDNPLAMVEWLTKLHVTRRAHPALVVYLAASDPDEILPYLPWHPKGSAIDLDEAPLLVVGASVVSAVEVLAARDWRTGGDVLVLPSGSTAVLGGS